MSKDPAIMDWRGYRSRNVRRRCRPLGGLHYIKGNRTPYFSLSGQDSYYDPQLHVWNDQDTFSMGRDEIIEHFPECKVLLDLHLSGIDGAPMHAVENGWHWLTGALYGTVPGLHGAYGPCTGSSTRTPSQCREVFYDYVRVTPDEAQKVFDHIQEVAQSVSHYSRVYERGHVTKCRTAFEAWVETQKPRWKQEADAVIKQFGLVVYGDPWSPS